MRPVDRGLLKRTTLLWLVCCAATLLVDRQAWLASWRGLTESILWLCILSLPAWSPHVSRFIAGLPRRHGWLLAAAFAMLLFGQLAGSEPGRFFPLCAWRMFGRPRSLQALTFFDYVGETAAGEPITLNPARLFPSINHTVMMALDDLAAADDRQRLASALRAIGRMHNRLSPAAPVRSVSLVRCTVDARAPADRRQVQRERVFTAEVTSER